MIATFLLLLVALETTPAVPKDAPGVAEPQQDKIRARTQALIGHNQLHLGRLADAKANCDAALSVDPANEIAKSCLDSLALMIIDQDLNSADARTLAGDKTAAINLASKWARTVVQADRRARAWTILGKARAASVREVVERFLPSWLREALFAIVTLLALGLLLQLMRKCWRGWKRGEWYGRLKKRRSNSTLSMLIKSFNPPAELETFCASTKWNMLPLKEAAANAEAHAALSTSLVLDAFGRLGHELKREPWIPKILLLRPTPPADYEPSIIESFLSETAPAPIALVPATKDIQLEWQMHDVHLDDALQMLQLKTGTGIDIGSMGRFFRAIAQWFNMGAPTITGTAESGTDNIVTIHLAASGGPVKCIAVTCSTASAPGINATQLSAERAAFKFLFRMRYPEMTTDEIDGFSALRQGATQFAQYAGTVAGVGDSAATRRSSLAKAAFNLNFFRASIPIHCRLGCVSNERTSLRITDDNRQSILLAEGIAYCLIASEHDRLERDQLHTGEDPVDHASIAEQNHMSAIDCFRQLQDWPGSEESLPLRQQAVYNEAVAWRQMGRCGRAVLMLVELLGLEVPDTIGQNADPMPRSLAKPVLPEAIRLPARLAMLSAFAQYDIDQWGTLPDDRAELLLRDAQSLAEDLQSVRTRSGINSHDKRLAAYMHTEALRALGHVALLRVITGRAKNLYENGRPVGLKTSELDSEGMDEVQKAIFWLKDCEASAPSCSLYCDLAEAYLLRKEFSVAQAYGRHATLHSDVQTEAAYYIAAESFSLENFFLENKDASIALAKKYAESYNGIITLEKFKSLRRDLKVAETLPENAQPSSPAMAIAARA